MSIVGNTARVFNPNVLRYEWRQWRNKCELNFIFAKINILLYFVIGISLISENENWMQWIMIYNFQKIYRKSIFNV